MVHFFSLDDFQGHELRAILETGEQEEEPQQAENLDELSRPGSNISSIEERLGEIKGVKHMEPWDEGEGGQGADGAGPSGGQGGAGTSASHQADRDPQPYVVGGYDADAESALKREAMAKAAKAVRWVGEGGALRGGGAPPMPPLQEMLQEMQCVPPRTGIQQS